MQLEQWSIHTMSALFASVRYALSEFLRTVSNVVRAEPILHFRHLLLVNVAAIIELMITLKDNVFLVTQIVRYVVTLRIRVVRLALQGRSNSPIGTHASNIAPQAPQRIISIITVEIYLPVLSSNFRLNHGQRTSNK